MGEINFRTTDSESTSETPTMSWDVGSEAASGQHDSGNLGENEPTTDFPSAVLNALGVDDQVGNIPSISKDNLNEIGSYLDGILKERGVVPTQRTISRILSELKFDMDIDFEAEPEAVIDKIAGLVKSWKGIVFIKDPRERRSLFMKLAKQPDSTSMDKVIFEEMERRKIWQ